MKFIPVITLLLLFITVPVHAYEFKYIKFKPTLKSNTQGFLATSKNDELKDKISQTILGLDKTSSYQKSDFEGSPLFERIKLEIEDNFQQIGEEQAERIDLLNREFNLGEQSFSGFNWQMPMGKIRPYFNRQVTPNLFGEDWLIQDTLEIEIEASSFLEALNQQNILDMTLDQLKAFVGIYFKRTYTSYHYAPSFTSGLKSDFKKLFLPFIYHSPKNAKLIKSEEIFKKEDQWSIKAGGIAQGTITPGLGIAGAIMLERNYSHQFSLHLNKNDYDLSVQTKKSTAAAIRLELQAEFFQILKISLLSSEFEYSLSQNISHQLKIPTFDFDKISQDEIGLKELKRTYKGNDKFDILEKFVSSHSYESTQEVVKNNKVLLWGKIKKTKTHEINIIQDNEQKTFFSYHLSWIKVQDNFWNKILGATIYRLLDLPSGNKASSILEKQIEFEYEKTHPQSTDPRLRKVNSLEELSMNLNFELQISKLNKTHINKTINFINNFSTLSPDYKIMIRNKILLPPLKIKSLVKINPQGLEHLIYQPLDDVFSHFVSLCKSNNLEKWMRFNRSKSLKKWQIGKDACVKDLGISYLIFQQDYLKTQEPSVERLKNFITKISLRINSSQDLGDLLSPTGFFLHGEFSATTAGQQPFFTTFHQGTFSGLGLIDNFKRAINDSTIFIPQE